VAHPDHWPRFLAEEVAENEQAGRIPSATRRDRHNPGEPGQDDAHDRGYIPATSPCASILSNQGKHSLQGYEYQLPASSRHQPAPTTEQSFRTLATTRGHASEPTTVQRPNSAASLPSLGVAFVSIPVGDHDECIRFITQNPTILNHDEKQYLREAVSALQSNKVQYARSCIQQALLLRKIKERSGRDRQKFVESLKAENANVVRDFVDDFDKAFTALDAAAGRTTPRASREAAVIDPALGSQGSVGVSRHGKPKDDLSSGLAGLAIDPSASGRGGHATGDRRRRDSVASQGTAPRTSRGTEFRGTTGDQEPLNSHYKKRQPADAGRFFKVGRVFSILWHESSGTGQGAVRGKHGEPVHSKIRRMAVVREGHGNCWAVPINTYGKQGVGKRGFNADDINGHAIIYMTGTSASRAPNEPVMSKSPIEVEPADQDQYLEHMSRINFTKIHTVEHNGRSCM
jgi:hypothetical protein